MHLTTLKHSNAVEDRNIALGIPGVAPRQRVLCPSAKGVTRRHRDTVVRNYQAVYIVKGSGGRQRVNREWCGYDVFGALDCLGYLCVRIYTFDVQNEKDEIRSG